MQFLWRTKRMWVGVLVGGALLHAGVASGERSARLPHGEAGVLRGVVKAATQAVLYTQIQGRISQLRYREGQRFEKGSTLVQIDCDKYLAELASAKAEHEAKAKTVDNNRALSTLNAVSALELEISEAEAKKARAAIQIAELNVRHCRIVAPFSGRVVGVMINEHENVFPNDKLLSLLDDTSLEIELILPSSSLSWLKRKAPLTFTIDETRQTYPAVIKEIGANVDPASQTIKVVATFAHLPPEILAGMSGSAHFEATQPTP